MTSRPTDQQPSVAIGKAANRASALVIPRDQGPLERQSLRPSA